MARGPQSMVGKALLMLATGGASALAEGATAAAGVAEAATTAGAAAEGASLADTFVGGAKELGKAAFDQTATGQLANAFSGTQGQSPLQAAGGALVGASLLGSGTEEEEQKQQPQIIPLINFF